MTPEEACLYLGISLDDEELDIDRIERNYTTKLSIYDPRRFNPDAPEYREARRMRRNIEEAYTVLMDAYDELYGADDEDDYTPPNRHTLLKVTALTTTIAALCLAGFIWLTYSETPKEKQIPYAEAVHAQDYERLLHEVERLREAAEERRPQAPAASTALPDYADLVERVMPSMVMIRTDIGTGSGFFVSSQGDILTNWHVIRDASRITVTPKDGLPVSALLKDCDTARDIALLKVNMTDATPFLRISPVLPRQGEAVMAVGSPRGYEGTVSNGIISAFRENNNIIQFTAPISQGSSGGALINLKGEVVGMPTKLRTDGQNLNFAIAPNVLAKFLEGAKDKPARALKRTTAEAHAYEDYGLKFVRSDESYEMYLETGNIDYDPSSSIASFVSVWLPTARTNAMMKRDPNFRAVRGKDFGPCMLVYVADLSEGTYIHLRTLNLYTDGTTARDYVRPVEQCRWERPTRGSRIDDLLKEVRRQLKQ